jgi:hypothetical protein
MVAYKIKLVFIVFFALISMGFTILIESIATTSYLASLSFVLLFSIVVSNVFFNKGSLISPLSFFSLMYLGYSLGGFYYATSDGYFGKFISFLNISRGLAEEYLVYSLIYAILCFFTFSLGYIVEKSSLKSDEGFVVNDFVFFVSRNYLKLSFPLLFIGAAYWYWVSVTIAGSVFQSLIYFQVFPHMAKEHGISIVPYLLYYSGIYIWLIGMIISGDKISIKFFALSIFGFLISLSTARITMSVTFLLSQLVFVYLITPSARKKIIIAIISLFTSAFLFYFLRELSNFYYLNDDANGLDLNVFKSIVGGGNVTDLQQLVAVFYSFDISQSLIGESYFDWLRNSVGVALGLEPSSVGLIIHNQYVPSTSGAPTPGAIGEAFANFNYAAPLFLFFIGMLFSFVHSKAMSSRNYFIIFTYSVFLVCFIFMYPKVDSTMIVNFFWGCVPTLLILIMYYFVFICLKRNHIS